MLDCIADNLLFDIIGISLLLSGVVGFLAMGLDKDRAVHYEWRISEKTLFIIALAGGWLGMILGSELFHHKTSKLSFLAVLYAIVGAWIFALQRVGFLGCLISGILHA